MFDLCGTDGVWLRSNIAAVNSISHYANEIARSVKRTDTWSLEDISTSNFYAKLTEPHAILV